MLDPIDVGVGFVEATEGVDVLVGDVLNRPGRHEVEQVGLVDPLRIRLLLDEAAFFLQPVPEARVRQRLQHPHHRGGDPGAGHEFDDAIARSGLFAIETDDEAGHHPEAVGVDPIDGFLEGAAGVLVLAGDRKAGLVGGLNAEEDRIKTALGHHLHQFLVRGQVHGGFRREAEGIAPLDLPLLQGRQQQFGVALVADEVVIHQEDRAPPAQVVEVLELGDQLLRRLGPGLAAVENDDVAELALERAAPGELHAHGVVGVELQQVKAGHRCGGDVRLLTVGAEAAAGLSLFDRLDEHRQGDFTLIEHLEVRQAQFRGIGGGAGEGTADRHG